MDLQLQGKVAVVAGASQGIGRATALSLAAEGARVVVAARSGDKLEALVAEIESAGGEVLAVVTDATNRGQVEALVERANRHWDQPLTIAVHAIAAVYQPSKLQFVEPAVVDEFLATDLRSAVDLFQLCLPHMVGARYGRILAVGSVAARTGVTGGTLYSAAKGGLEGLIRGIALDYSRRGVTANVANVAFADSERLQARVAGRPEARRRLEDATATKRIPASEEIADFLCYLASPRARSITGACLDITAGGHLNNLW